MVVQVFNNPDLPAKGRIGGAGLTFDPWFSVSQPFFKPRSHRQTGFQPAFRNSRSSNHPSHSLSVQFSNQRLTLEAPQRGRHVASVHGFLPLDLHVAYLASGLFGLVKFISRIPKCSQVACPSISGRCCWRFVWSFPKRTGPWASSATLVHGLVSKRIEGRVARPCHGASDGSHARRSQTGDETPH